MIEYSDQNEEIYSHPYLFEIDNLKLAPQQLEKTTFSSKVSDIDETELVFVDSKSKLEQLIQDLKDCTVSVFFLKKILFWDNYLHCKYLLRIFQMNENYS